MKQAALPSPIPTQTVLAAASIHSHDICLQIDVVSLPCHVEAVLRLGSGEKAVQSFKLLLEVPVAAAVDAPCPMSHVLLARSREPRCR